MRISHSALPLVGCALLVAACASPSGEEQTGEQSGAAVDAWKCERLEETVRGIANFEDECFAGDDDYPKEMAAYRGLVDLAKSCPAEAHALARSPAFASSSVYGVRVMRGAPDDFRGVSFYASAEGSDVDEPFGTFVMNLRADGNVEVVFSVSGPDDPQTIGTYSTLYDASGTWVTIFASDLADKKIAGTYRLVEGQRGAYVDHQLQGAGNGLVFRSFWHSACRGI